MKAIVSSKEAISVIENCISIAQVNDNKYIENELKKVIDYLSKNIVSLQDK